MPTTRLKKNRDDIFLFKTFFKVKTELTEAQISYFKKHPEKIEAVTAPHTVHRLFLLGGMLFGIAFVILSKALNLWGALKGLHPLVEESLVDITFEIGVALIGGGVTAYFLGILLNQQQQNAERWKEEIYSQIGDRE